MYALLSIVAITSATVLGPASPRSDEVDIPVSEVPASFRKAAEEAVPRAHWDAAGREVEDGKTFYSLYGEDARGRSVEVTFHSDGTVNYVDTKIAEGDVPEVVRRALSMAAPQFRPTGFAEVIHEGRLAGYAFDGEPTGKVAGAFIDPEGKKVQLCDEDGELL